MDINEVLKYLPHRYPFLLIDRVREYELGKSLVAIKNVSFNEPFFTGHFPQRPVMPGVLILEAMAQATGILAFKSTDTLPAEGSLYFLAGVDDARFKHPVEPGDQLLIRVEVVKRMRSIWKFSAEATVDGKLAASAQLMCAERPAE
ncbi:3-hydroxyacyl-ACP dehydratase FabZ [Ectothiorhodospiraceae bacterium 2226]|nr:3-hydroxyacyl-ACP dehydratase FabZ [Ectothiorhodospiraceae bacterium 2226]